MADDPNANPAAAVYEDLLQTAAIAQVPPIEPASQNDSIMSVTGTVTGGNSVAASAGAAAPVDTSRIERIIVIGLVVLAVLHLFSKKG